VPRRGISFQPAARAGRAALAVRTRQFPSGTLSSSSVETGTLTSPLDSRLHRWLSPGEVPRPADLIFVFAGGMDRKNYALELFRQDFAPAILLSVGRFEIRRFSKMSLPVPLDLLEMAQPVPPPRRHYFVFFCGQTVQVELIARERLGTLSEVRALVRWLAQHPEIRSLLVVSSEAHLRRIRMSCRALLPSQVPVAYVAAASAYQSKAEQGPPPPSHMDDLLELLKLSVYWMLLKLRKTEESAYERRR